MKCQFVLPVCLLLLWTLTAPVSVKATELSVSNLPNGIKLSCSGGYNVEPGGHPVLSLDYNDENTGEYACEGLETEGNEAIGQTIYVKFRSCDNCIELDSLSLTGMIIGDVVATIVIGVAVYLIASQTRIHPVTSHKKSSDRQHLVPNEVRRAPNDLYQPLNGRQKETAYDVLNRK